jgi:hypothetical protein
VRVSCWELLLVRLVFAALALLARVLELLLSVALWVVKGLVGLIRGPLLRELAYAIGRARGRRALARGTLYAPVAPCGARTPRHEASVRHRARTRPDTAIGRGRDSRRHERA